MLTKLTGDWCTNRNQVSQVSEWLVTETPCKKKSIGIGNSAGRFCFSLAEFMRGKWLWSIPLQMPYPHIHVWEFPEGSRDLGIDLVMWQLLGNVKAYVHTLWLGKDRALHHTLSGFGRTVFSVKAWPVCCVKFWRVNLSPASPRLLPETSFAKRDLQEPCFFDFLCFFFF